MVWTWGLDAVTHHYSVVFVGTSLLCRMNVLCFGILGSCCYGSSCLKVGQILVNLRTCLKVISHNPAFDCKLILRVFQLADDSFDGFDGGVAFHGWLACWSNSLDHEMMTTGATGHNLMTATAHPGPQVWTIFVHTIFWTVWRYQPHLGELGRTLVDHHQYDCNTPVGDYMTSWGGCHPHIVWGMYAGTSTYWWTSLRVSLLNCLDACGSEQNTTGDGGQCCWKYSWRMQWNCQMLILTLVRCKSCNPCITVCVVVLVVHTMGAV